MSRLEVYVRTCSIAYAFCSTNLII